jgi:hypothetical protein
MQLYDTSFFGSLNHKFVAVDVPFCKFSRRNRWAADLRPRSRQRARWRTYVSLLAVLSCVPFALSGCGGTEIIGTAAQAGSLSASPSIVAVGSVPVGQTASSTVSLQNSGSAAVQVTQVSVTGQPFSVSGVYDLPVTIGARETYNLSVQFSPQATGTATGQLTITSNASSNGTMVIGLNGTGITASTQTTLTSLTCTSASMTGAGTDSCTVTLNAAADSGGFAVSLASNNSAVAVPATVTVPAGATSASFAATVSSVSSAQTVTLTASAGGVAETFALQLNASVQNPPALPVLSGLSCTSGSMTGAGTDSCTVTLNAAAASGGFTVSLASNNSAVAVPASVTVAAGATSASFTATVSAVSTAQTVTLTASAGGVSTTFALQLGTSQIALSLSTASLAFGNVNVSTAATQSVTLTSTGTAAVTVSAATVMGSGFSVSGATFPLTLNPNQTATLTVQFDPGAAGAVTGQLTLTSNSSSGSSTVVSLSGTGVQDSYEVDLSWDAPTSSPDPVAGYNVYRSPSGASSYQQLNSSVVTQTTYVDTTVQAGQNYDYIVESVDASGVTSVPSNTANATLQ